MTHYTINGTRFESASAVVAAFLDGAADPCTKLDDVYEVVNAIEDAAKDQRHPLDDDSLNRLCDALCEYYGIAA